MVRLISIFFLSFLIDSCTTNQSQPKQTLKSDYPKSTDFKKLPEEIHVIGNILEISYGNCGIICKGGLLKVNLESNIPHYNFKSVYLITACLSIEAKLNSKIDVKASLHTGKEKECYYINFVKPKNIEDLIFYQLSEDETSKIR